MLAGHRIEFMLCLILTLTLLQPQAGGAQVSPPLILLTPGESLSFTSPNYQYARERPPVREQI